MSGESILVPVPCARQTVSLLSTQPHSQGPLLTILFLFPSRLHPASSILPVTVGWSCCHGSASPVSNLSLDHWSEARKFLDTGAGAQDTRDERKVSTGCQSLLKIRASHPRPVFLLLLVMHGDSLVQRVETQRNGPASHISCHRD